MAVDVDTILRLKGEGATRVVLHPDGSLAQVEFGASMPATEEDQDEHTNPAATHPRRPTGGLVTRGDPDR